MEESRSVRRTGAGAVVLASLFVVLSAVAPADAALLRPAVEAGLAARGAAPAASSSAAHPGIRGYRIDADSQGLIEYVDGIYNTSIVSTHRNVFRAEYEAGFIQGRLQRAQIVAARDNCWDSAYLVDPTHSFPKAVPPTPQELAEARDVLTTNWKYTLEYIRTADDRVVAGRLRRLMYRLLGIYHGATLQRPRSMPFAAGWEPSLKPAELSLGYETKSLTFLDVYWINANQDALCMLPETPVSHEIADGRPSKCSAFVLSRDGETYLTHNNWNSFLDQSQALSLWLAGDFMTANIASPGLLCSNVDFGYTNKGLIFNETTHRWSKTEARADRLWMFWRAALAEQFSDSIDEFFRLISLQASGTYMNGYMVTDVKTGEIGYVEMSYDAFVFYRPNGNDAVEVTTRPAGLSTEYDTQLVTPTYVLGINFPASQVVRSELESVDNRPARRPQFMARIGGVHDVQSAKALITYTDPANPLSIYGRWDLGYGITPAPKTVPDGSCDAKVVTASQVRRSFKLTGVLDKDAGTTAFWMKYGTPEVNGEPFIWSRSQWAGQKLRFVPDRVAGGWQLLHLHIR